MIRALALPFLLAATAFAEAPRTIDSLREDLARDFPPSSGVTHSLDPVAIDESGRVRVAGLGEEEKAFLARVFKKMKFGANRKVHMVTLIFTRPSAYTSHSFVEADEEGRIRIVQGLKIFVDASGKVTTISPYFPPDGPPGDGG